MTKYKNILLTVTGPSVTGKTTMAKLLEDYGFNEVVSTTTRPQRASETPGVSYHFVDKEEFLKLYNAGEMIEKVEVGSNFYGVSKKALDDVILSGKNAAVVVEPDGAQQVRRFAEKNNIPIFQIFLDNPTELLVERFLERYKNDIKADNKTYARRIIDMLVEEPKKWIEPAYNGKHKYDLVFKTFTPDNQNQVISDVLEGLQKKFSNDSDLFSAVSGSKKKLKK